MKLLKYIQGFHKGKEAHRIEKEAMRDPFLREALEGFDSVPDDHLKQIEALRRQVEIRSQGSNRQRLLWGWGIAASLFVCAFLGGYYLLQPQRWPDTEFALERDTLHRPSPLMTPAAPEERVTRTREPERKTAPLPEQPNEKKAMTATLTPSFTDVIPDTQEIRAENRTEPQENRRSENQQTPPEGKEEPEEQVSDSGLLPEQPERLTAISPDPASPDIHKIQPVKWISGRVVSAENGEPIVGANVAIAGTQKGTITDINGYFDITTNEGERIQISYIGYDQVSLPLDTTRILTIQLHEDVQTLDELVVTTYGRIIRRDMTGSATRVKGITPRPVPGKRAYRKYLKENIRLPDTGACAKVKGKVVLYFFVNEQGRPYHIHVRKGLCPQQNEEAIRLVEEGPDWRPGNKKVRLSIRFRPLPVEE